MRILVLNYEFPPLGGGASPVSYEICKGLVKLGNKVDVVTMSYKNLPSFEVIDGINVYRVKSIRSKKEICKTHEMLSYVISAKWFLRKHLKKHKYDICHSHFIIPTGIVALWVKKKFGLDYIVTSHGSDVIGYNKRFNKVYPLVKNTWVKVVNNSKKITTPSLFLQNEIKKLVPNANYEIIPNGIDTEHFIPLKKEKIILIVARLFINKGVQDILDALKGVDLGEWSVLIVGDGPYKEVLVEKCKENKLPMNKINFLGWVDNKSNKMKELYGKASIFISASYFENQSMVLLEALASNCYVLASNVGGNPEVIPDYGLFQAKNIKELRSKITQLINTKDINKMELNKKFLLDNVNKKFDDLLKK